MAESFVNDWATTLDGGINDSTTTIVVADSPPSGLTADFRVRIDDELLKVTAIGGTGNKTWTVVREAEESSRFPAASHSSGAAVTHVLTAGSRGTGIDDKIAAHVANAGAHHTQEHAALLGAVLAGVTI